MSRPIYGDPIYHEEPYGGDQWLEHCEYEANASYDYMREAYAASQPDPIYEGYCSHCDSCEEAGLPCPTFEEFQASLSEPPKQWVWGAAPDSEIDDEIPF